MNFIQIFLVIFGLLILGFSFEETKAELLSNNFYIIEGSGFAVTENSIKSSQMDIAASAGFIANGRGTLGIEDGFVTLNDNDYVAEELIGTILRDGKFIRISGTAHGFDDKQITITLFGRLIQDTSQGSIYSFTGRIIENNISHKIIYTAKISGLTITPQVTILPKIIEDKTITVKINPGSFDQGKSVNYIEANSGRYFSQDRVTLDPGTTITIENNDSVSHSILSGKEDRDRHQKFTADGRINTGAILPGQSVDITFKEIGFYRLYDPNYQWMQIVVYSFPNTDNLIFGSTVNQQGN